MAEYNILLRAKDFVSNELKKIEGQFKRLSMGAKETGDSLGFTEKKFTSFIQRFVGFAAIAMTVQKAISAVKRELSESVKAYESWAIASNNVDAEKIKAVNRELEIARITLGEKIFPIVESLSKIKLGFVEQLSGLFVGRNEAALSANIKIFDDLQAELKEMQAQVAGAEKTGQREILLIMGGESRTVSTDVAKAEIEAIKSQIQAISARTTELTAPKQTTEELKAQEALRKKQQADAEKRLQEQQKAIDEANKKRIEALSKAGEEENKLRQRSADFADDIQKRQIELSIATMSSEYERKKATIAFQEQEAINEYLTNAEMFGVAVKEREDYITAIRAEAARQRTDIYIEEGEKRRQQAEKEAAEEKQRLLDNYQLQENLTGSLINLGFTAIAASEKNKEKQRKIAATEALIQGILAGGYASAKIWSSSKTWYEALAAQIAVGAQVTAQTIASVAAIRSAKNGADFVTSGPQLMLVGDNPSGRERVTVTPAENNNINNNASANITLNIQGNADKETIDYSITQLESFARRYNMAKVEGMIR